MGERRSRRRRRHLRRELHKIHGAVEAARILSEAVATDQLGPERDHRRAPRAIASLLELVGERLQDLRRAARRRGAPQEAPAEEAGDSGGAGDPGGAGGTGGAGGAGGARTADGPRTADEWVLAICAQRQRAGGRARGVRGVA